MKNILAQKPTSPLNPRLTESTIFVQDSDIKDRRILDIGCGFGWFENNVLSRGVERVDAIEITEEDFRTADENLDDERVVFTVAGALDVPFPDHSFDTVVSWEVIEHIPKGTEMQMFNEVARVLKPGGHFYMSTPYNSTSSKLMDPAWWLVGHRHYSAEALRVFGESVGLKVVEMRRKGGYWSLLSSLNMYFSKWVLRRAPIFERFFLKKEFAEYEADGQFANIFVKFQRDS